MYVTAGLQTCGNNINIILSTAARLYVKLFRYAVAVNMAFIYPAVFQNRRLQTYCAAGAKKYIQKYKFLKVHPFDNFC